MSDMQTALTRALEEGKRRFMAATLEDWEKHEREIRSTQPEPQPQQEKAMAYVIPERNLTKAIFQYIHNGACTPNEVIADMVKQGYKKVSASSLLTQMKRKGLIRTEGEYLVTNHDQYIPLGRVYKKYKAKHHKPTTHGIAALNAGTTPVAVAPVAPQWDAETVIANIGIKEAFKLYEELSKYFGHKG